MCHWTWQEAEWSGGKWASCSVLDWSRLLPEGENKGMVGGRKKGSPKPKQQKTKPNSSLSGLQKVDLNELLVLLTYADLAQRRGRVGHTRKHTMSQQ